LYNLSGSLYLDLFLLGSYSFIIYLPLEGK
jgi:hypothetical protein